MATTEEQVRILEMIQSGKITAEEGNRLLEALKEKERADEMGKPASKGQKPRQIRIRVTDLDTGRRKADISIPWGLVSVGVNMGARFARKEIKGEDFVEAVQAGVLGKIIDVIDEEDNERVEIFAE